MLFSGKLEKLLCGCLAAALLAACIPAATVLADSTSNLTIGGNKEVGSTITATVSVSGDGPYAGYNGSFSYDSKLFELQSIAPGDYNKAHFDYDGVNFTDFEANIGDGTSIVIATFKCIAAGTGSIACNIEDMATMDTIPVSVTSSSASVTVNTPVAKSSDASLASLSISPGKLSPDFSASKTSYTATVDAAQSKITVSAKAADSKAKVSLNGVQDKLVSGDNTVKITITAENGATNVYSIKVTRAVGPTPTPGPTPAPLPLVNYGGTDYTILTAGEGDAIPTGFSATTVKYKNVDIPALALSYGDTPDAVAVTIVYLTADNNTGYFVYDPATETCYPYVTISPSAVSYQILGKSDSIAVPAGYEEFEYAYQNENIAAYRLISDPQNPQILLYLMDGAGVSGFFYYDTINGMILPYRGEVIIAQPSAVPTSAPTSNPTLAVTSVPAIAATTGRTGGTTSLLTSLSDLSNPVVLMMYFFAIGFIILAVICIVQFIKARKREYEYGDEYDDSPYADETDPASDEQSYSHFYTLNRPRGKFGRNSRETLDDSEVDYLDIPDIHQEKSSANMDIEDPDYDPSDMPAKRAVIANIAEKTPLMPPVQTYTRPISTSGGKDAAAAPVEAQGPAAVPVVPRPAVPPETQRPAAPAMPRPVAPAETLRPATTSIEAQRPAAPAMPRPVAPAETPRPAAASIETQRPAAPAIPRPVAPAETPRPAAASIETQRPAAASIETQRPAAVPVVSRPAVLPEAQRPAAPAMPRPVTPAETPRPAAAPIDQRPAATSAPMRPAAPADIIYKAVPKQTGASQKGFGGIEPGPKAQDSTERTLDFPKIDTAKREEHVPVRLQRDLEMEKARREEALHSNNTISQNPPARPRNGEKMPRGTRAPNLGFLINDPDIDPDDK